MREPEDKQRDGMSDRTGESEPPIEDLFDYGEDDVDFMSAESFPASDPPPPQREAPPHDNPPPAHG